MTEDISKKIASLLLEVKAVKLSPDQPFTWASGWKSPIYCDNRITLAFPEARTYITNQLADIIRTRYHQAELIAGVATAGIPQAALVAEKLNLPMAYVRAKPKSHGMTNLIEGKVEKGQRVVVIEDLISTGGSSIKAVEGLREAGADVLGLVAIFTYGFEVASHSFKEANVPYATLGRYHELIQIAVEQDYVKPEQLDKLNSWREDPSVWGI